MTWLKNNKFKILITLGIIIAVYFGFKFYNDYQTEKQQNNKMLQYYDSVIKANNYKIGFIEGQNTEFENRITVLESQRAVIRNNIIIKQKEYKEKPTSEKDKLFMERFGK